MIRLDKYLAHAKLGTRREVKKLIRRGAVYVNNELCRNDDEKIDENTAVVEANGEVVQYAKNHYIMLHKPQGHVSASIDNLYPTVLDLIYEDYALDLFCVGRLDVDTEGLLILCDDGSMSHALLSPKKHVEKEYHVELEKSYSQADIEALEGGISISDDEVCKEAKVKVIDEKTLTLTITEGKFHQVKRMMHAIDNDVTYLKRIRMNKLFLDEELEVGSYKVLTSDELALLKGEA